MHFPAHAATSLLMASFIMHQIDQVQLQELHTGLLTFLNEVVLLVADAASKHNGFPLSFDGFDLQLSASAVVTGLAFNARSRHGLVELAFETAWTNMRSHGQLSSPWSQDGFPLRDFVVFVSCMKRYRKKNKYATLKGPSIALLDCLLAGTARFISLGLDLHVMDNMSSFLGKKHHQQEEGSLPWMFRPCVSYFYLQCIIDDMIFHALSMLAYLCASMSDVLWIKVCLTNMDVIEF